MIDLTAAEMAELAEYTRKWMNEAHATTKRAERDAQAARKASMLRVARGAFDEAMRHVPSTTAAAINAYIRAIKS